MQYRVESVHVCPRQDCLSPGEQDGHVDCYLHGRPDQDDVTHVHPSAVYDEVVRSEEKAGD